MRKTLVFFLSFIFVLAYSQNKVNAFYQMAAESNELPDKLHLLIQGNISKLEESSQELGLLIKYSAGNIASIVIPKDKVSALLERKFVTYLEYQLNEVSLLNDTMLVKNRIKDVKNGIPPIAQPYNGNGVIVGIMDSGIDFNHPDFKLSNGNTRVLYIWDQAAPNGSATPLPYGYGVEWTAAQINASLCTHSDLPYSGHGTHVSGIAAGNGLATGTHEGVASEADLIVVAMQFNSPNPIYSDAVNYILSKAQSLGKPCVINASVGTYIGSHDGTDLQAKLISNMLQAQPGRAMVAAAGNAGNIKYHVKTAINGTDTLFTWVKRPSGIIHLFVYADTAQLKNVHMSIGVNRPNFDDLGRIPFHNYNYGLSGIKIDTLKYNNKRIGIIRTSGSINTSGVYERYYRITPDSLNYNWRMESTGNGLHDVWNFDLVSTGLPTITQYSNMAYYVMPDTLSTIVTSFQCSDDVITVGNYINLSTYFDVNNNLQNTGETPGKIKENSSCGPTRDNRTKPEVCATGANVFAAMALGMQSNLVTNFPQVVAQGSFHVQGGGTSAASPVVAGLAALYLQAYPAATNKNVRDAIKNCTYTDGFTGSVPNHAYGYGKLDGKAAMLCTIFTGIPKLSLGDNLRAYPNPFSENITIEIPGGKPSVIELYDSSGRLLLSEVCNNNEYYFSKGKIGNYKGLLLMRVQSKDKAYSVKLICD